MVSKTIEVVTALNSIGWNGQKEEGTIVMQDDSHSIHRKNFLMEHNDPAAIKTRSLDYRQQRLGGIYRRPGVIYEHRTIKQRSLVQLLENR